MAIEVEGCQAVCSSVAEDLPVLYGTGPEQVTQSPPTLYCEADSSEPLSERVADLALVSPPANDADPLGEDQSLAVLTASSDCVSSTAEDCNSTDTCAESVEAAAESPISTSSLLVVAAKAADVNTFRSRSCFESTKFGVERGTTTTPSLMCNNSAGPAVAAPSSVLAVCGGFFLDNDSEDFTTVPWSPTMEPGLELTMDAMPRTGHQVTAGAEEEPHEPDSSEAQEFTTGEVAEESRNAERGTAGTDTDTEKQSIVGSEDMELSFADSFSEKVDGECGALEISTDGTFAELELLDDETQMEDTITGASNNASTAVPDTCVADASVSTSTAGPTHGGATDDYNTCDLDSSDDCSNTVTEEGNIMPPKITAAIVVQSNTSYMGNSSSSDDDEEDEEEEEEDEEVESSDGESLLGRDSPSPPGVDDSSLFPSVEEVETRTGISFESSGGPSCSAPSFGSVAGVAPSAAGSNNSNTADTRRKAITLIDHHFRQIIDVERDLRRYVLHKTNLNRLYQEIREEKLSSHRRQRSGTSHHHHHHHHQQHHHHSAAQNNSNNLPSSSFLSNPSVSPLTARSYSPHPFGDSSHLNPQSYNRPGAPFTMGGEPISGGSSSSFCRQSAYSGQASAAQSYGGQHDDCQDAMLEPAPKRARLSCPAEEDKENKFSSAPPPTASVFGSGGHSYTPATGAEFYHHQVGCSSVSGAPSSSCGGDVTTTSTTTPLYSGCNSTGSGNGYYQNQASPAYGAYYNNNSFYANNMSYTPNGHFMGNFSNNSSESNGTCNLSSSSTSSSNGNYAMATGPVEADAYNNVSNNNCNNVNSLDRGFNNNLNSSSSSSCSDIIGFRSNNDIIIEHIDEEIRRQNSITSNNRPSSCPPFSSSSSLFSSSSIFSSSSYYSQSLSSSQASSSSTPSLYNTGNSSLQYNNLNHFSGGAGWNSSYTPLYGTSSSSSGPTHSSPPQQQPLQPYPCGRSSLMRGGNDFQSVVYSSLLASLET